MTDQRSSRACAHYRQLVQDANAEPIQLNQTTDVTDAEIFWCDLTPLEAWVFRIDPSLLNALVYAMTRYQDMIGCTDIEFCEYREEERAAYPQFFKGECVFTVEAAVGFMIEACGMPFDQALVWVSRSLIQNVRSNLYDLSDPAPAWAHGEVDPAVAAYPDPDDWTLLGARGSP